MNITQAIQEMYPGLELGRDFFVRDDGAGPYLESWNNPNPRPTDAQLRAAWFSAVKKARKAHYSGRAIDEMEAQFPEVRDNPRRAIWIAFVMGMSNSADPKMVAVKASKAKMERAHALVDSPTIITPEQVQALPAWEAVQ